MTRPIWSIGVVLVAVLIWGWSAPGWAEDTAAGDMTVADGKQVSFEYTLTLGDGTQAGTNVGQEPLVYIHGGGEIVKGLEQGLLGLKAGDKKKVMVSPQDGYGELDPSRTQQVPLDRIPEKARKVGARLQGEGPDGQIMFAKITAVDDETATIDLNHPLAGQDLTFDITILKVEEAGNRIEMPPSLTIPTESGQ